MSRSPALLLTTLTLAAAAACSSDSTMNPADATPSRAFGIWKPGPGETCTKEQHDAYAVVGPDGKLLSHVAPADRTRDGCTLRPRARARPARLQSVRRQPAAHSVRRTPTRRWRSAIPRTAERGSRRPQGRVGERRGARRSAGVGRCSACKCDVLTKLHQGTHSKDAFTNNLHELVYHLDCDGRHRAARHAADRDRHAGRVRPLVRPGRPRRGRAADARQLARTAAASALIPGPQLRRAVHAGAAAASSPTSIGAARDLGDVQQRPARRRTYAGVLQSVLPGAPAEPVLRSRHRADGRAGRSTCCYEVTAAGDRATGGAVRRVHRQRPDGGRDVRRSALGVQRRGHFVDINATASATSDGPDGVVHRCVSGETDRRRPFAGSIRQAIAQVDNAIGVDVGGPVIGKDRSVRRSRRPRAELIPRA